MCQLPAIRLNNKDPLTLEGKHRGNPVMATKSLIVGANILC